MGGNWGEVLALVLSVIRGIVKFSGNINLLHSDFKKHVCFDIFLLKFII